MKKLLPLLLFFGCGKSHTALTPPEFDPLSATVTLTAVFDSTDCAFTLMAKASDPFVLVSYTYQLTLLADGDTTYVTANDAGSFQDVLFQSWRRALAPHSRLTQRVMMSLNAHTGHIGWYDVTAGCP